MEPINLSTPDACQSEEQFHMGIGMRMYVCIQRNEWESRELELPCAYSIIVRRHEVRYKGRSRCHR